MSNEYKDWYEDLENSTDPAEHNEWLTMEFPFLFPFDMNDESKFDAYDFSHTMLDDMPPGWRKNFGLKMCRELRHYARKNGIEDLRILKLEEKNGSLRIRVNTLNDNILAVIDKYERISMKVCYSCGDIATKRSMHHIAPWCTKCANEMIETFIDI